jgi:arylsulfatase A-like enzyme
MMLARQQGTNANARGGDAPNLLLVTVDCLRRDRLSAYGYERRTTPFLDSMLERALHCTSAHSVSSWTCPSVVSLLSGLYPHRHGGGVVPGEPKNLSKHNLPTKAPQDLPLLPDLLAERGYATAAFGAVWNAHLSVPERFGEMVMMEKPAPKLVDRSLAWMRARAGEERPFLLWLHLGDTHEPLDVRKDLRDVFGPVPRIKKLREWDYTKSSDAVGTEVFRKYRDARILLYDAATRSVDASLEDLWKAMESLGMNERTVWVVTADHGEEFWEHRDEELASFTDPRDVYGTGHGHNLFQVHLLVPLLAFGPGIPAGALERNVSLVDVFPTVLAALGVDGPSVDGRSLLEDGGSGADRPIFAEAIAYGFEKRAVIDGDLKLLSAPSDGYESLVRLGPDRLESERVEDPAEADRLRGLLPGAQEVLGEQVQATEEILEHLRGLGYID